MIVLGVDNKWCFFSPLSCLFFTQRCPASGCGYVSCEARPLHIRSSVSLPELLWADASLQPADRSPSASAHPASWILHLRESRMLFTAKMLYIWVSCCRLHLCCPVVLVVLVQKCELLLCFFSLIYFALLRGHMTWTKLASFKQNHNILCLKEVHFYSLLHAVLFIIKCNSVFGSSHFCHYWLADVLQFSLRLALLNQSLVFESYVCL